jgi:hypothetical protein
MQMNWTSLTHAIAGKVYFGKNVITDLNHLKRVRETVKDVQQIDLYLWLQMNKDLDIIQLRFIIKPDSEVIGHVKEICNKLEPLPSDKCFHN